MPAHDDHGRHSFKLMQPFPQPVRPGDADIMNHPHLDAHPVERFASFLSNGYVGGAGRDNGHAGGMRNGSAESL